MRLRVQNVIEGGFLSWSQLALQLHYGRCRMTPNPSFKPTRYGRQRKPGLRHFVHHLSPGLRCLP
jgi:hypothetical protein